MVEKTSYLLDKKVKRKNQVPEYYAPSPKGYNEEDTRSIDEEPPNRMGYWGEKPKNLWSVIDEKTC